MKRSEVVFVLIVGVAALYPIVCPAPRFKTPDEQREFEKKYDKKEILRQAEMQIDTSDAFITIPTDYPEVKDFDVAKTPPNPVTGRTTPMRVHTKVKDADGAFWCIDVFGTLFKFFPAGTERKWSVLTGAKKANIPPTYVSVRESVISITSLAPITQQTLMERLSSSTIRKQIAKRLSLSSTIFILMTTVTLPVAPTVLNLMKKANPSFSIRMGDSPRRNWGQHTAGRLYSMSIYPNQNAWNSMK